VLTSPVIRCLKTQIKDVEIHFVTKEIFSDILINNPHINRVHSFKSDVNELFDVLKAQKFDYVIDLHKNLRSYRLKQKLGVKSFSFNKLNIEKLLAVKLKAINNLPPIHIVERYLETVKELGVVNDQVGLDYFIAKKDEVDVASIYFKGVAKRFIVLVLGGSYYTKQIPYAKLKEMCATAKLPIVLMGGKSDVPIAEELVKEFPNLMNTCGKFSINQSASIISQCEWVISSDTGLMHIASAFNKKIISIWGNTIPQFGMSPYKPNTENKIIEVKNLSCRPCSKLGYKKCPKGHFKCMNEIDVSFVNELV
jgi:ADP-heptose:LPS heptosyltransferase